MSGSEQAGIVHGAGQKLEAHDTSTGIQKNRIQIQNYFIYPRGEIELVC